MTKQLIVRLEYINNWTVFWILVLFALSTSVGSAVVNFDGPDAIWWSGWLQNFSTEMMGAIITFGLIEVVIGTRQQQETAETQQQWLQDRLVREARSTVRDTAVHAIEELRNHSWLEGENGLLKGADLGEAQLEGAKLHFANLEGAILWNANLEGANLGTANLFGANLELAIFDDKTVLPDVRQMRNEAGEFLRDADGRFLFTPESYWTPETDMTRYTDPDHPDFWPAPTQG